MASTLTKTSTEPTNQAGQQSRSVRTKLLWAFGSVIASSFLMMLAFVIIHLNIVRQYTDITNRLTQENRLAILIPELADDFFGVVNSLGEAKSQAIYQAKHDEVLATVAQLDRIVTDPSSQASYRGLKNYVLSIVKFSDQGLADLAGGSVSDARDVYSKDVAPLKTFVVDNTGSLMVSELAVADKIQKQVDATHQVMLWLTLVLFLLVAATNIINILVSLGQLISPLEQLTGVAQEISGGKLDVQVDPGLLARQDEIGSLTNSFQEMLRKLLAELEKQRGANASLEKVSLELAENNANLQRTNRLMVDREMKMVELKKYITDLEEKIRGLGGTA